MRLRTYLRNLRRSVTSPIKRHLRRYKTSKTPSNVVVSEPQTATIVENVVEPSTNATSILPQPDVQTDVCVDAVPLQIEEPIAVIAEIPAEPPKLIPEVPQPVSSQTIDNGATKLLLAFLKASQRSDKPTGRAFEPISIGDGRMLVPHPTAEFMYTDTSNIKVLPKLVLGTFQERTTVAIEREFNRGDNVIHLGADNGYHTLTLSCVVGETGRVLAIENRASELAMLRMNVEAHSLKDKVSICELTQREPFPFLQFHALYRTIAGIVVPADWDIPEMWLSGLSEFFSNSARTKFVYGSRTLPFVEYLASRKQLRASERRAA